MLKIKNIIKTKFMINKLCHNSAILPNTKNELSFLMKVMKNNGYSIYFSDFHYINAKEKFNNNVLKKWLNANPETILESLRHLKHYYSMNNIKTDLKYHNFYDITSTSECELKAIFTLLSDNPNPEMIHINKYLKIRAALEDECLKKLHTLTTEDMLSYMLIFFTLNEFQYSNFYVQCARRLASEARNLTKPQIVQTLFYIGRSLNSEHNAMNQLENCIEDRFSEFHIDELAIVALAFFRGRSRIRSTTLITKFINKVMENSSNVQDISLSSILKVIRYSADYSFVNKIYELLECLQYQVPRLSTMCNTQIALVGLSTLVLHESCLNKISEKVLNNMSICRIKDLERFVLTFGTLNYVPLTKDNLIDKLIDEMNQDGREGEIRAFRKEFASCVAYLGLSNVYPFDLMKTILQRNFFDANDKYKYVYGEELLRVHNTAKIFYPDSITSGLAYEEVFALSKKYTDRVPHEKDYRCFTKIEHMLITIKTALQEMRGGDAFVTCDHILTHYQIGDIIICNDRDGVPMPVDKAFAGKQFGMIHYPPDSNMWIVIIIAGRNKMIANNCKPVGSVIAKERELKKLGYNTAIVLWDDFVKYLNHEAIIFYLENLINKAIEN